MVEQRPDNITSALVSFGISVPHPGTEKAMSTWTGPATGARAQRMMRKGNWERQKGERGSQGQGATTQAKAGRHPCRGDAKGGKGARVLEGVETEGVRCSCPANPPKSPDCVHPLSKTLGRCSETPPSGHSLASSAGTQVAAELAAALLPSSSSLPRVWE